jgi:hypothetical protein
MLIICDVVFLVQYLDGNSYVPHQACMYVCMYDCYRDFSILVRPWVPSNTYLCLLLYSSVSGQGWSGKIARIHNYKQRRVGGRLRCSWSDYMLVLS